MRDQVNTWPDKTGTICLQMYGTSPLQTEKTANAIVQPD